MKQCNACNKCTTSYCYDDSGGQAVYFLALTAQMSARCVMAFEMGVTSVGVATVVTTDGASVAWLMRRWRHGGRWTVARAAGDGHCCYYWCSRSRMQSLGIALQPGVPRQAAAGGGGGKAGGGHFAWDGTSWVLAAAAGAWPSWDKGSERRGTGARGQPELVLTEARRLGRACVASERVAV